MKILVQVAALEWILLVPLMVGCAHASAVETTTDLVDAAVTNASVVSSWKAACEHLQRINLSGTGCRPYWDVVRPPADFSLPKNQLEIVCPKLCINNLGLPSCVCIAPYDRLREYDRNGICQLFCTISMSLDGCTPCVEMETTTEEPSTTLAPTTEPTTTTTTVKTTTTRTTSTTKTTKTTTKTTTPDWDALCNTLCQTGDGGVLCNCDLPPFF
ncbi:uncharacterized protein LOC129793105 [Lutzomyia longipalpis]|uniref:Putative conserved secreted protein n=1 Tax=Lutzomyia longipalpis TaxID=7200 RepID=A0A7G3AL55_LUTLO|nr:uncharacterized protein LOC129793105 [Lutzomyia longipalpis]